MTTKHGVHTNIDVEFKLLCDNWCCEHWEWDVYGTDENEVIEAGIYQGWLISDNICLCPICKNQYQILADLEVGTIIAFTNGDRIEIVEQTDTETLIEMLHELNAYENHKNTLRNNIKIEDLGIIESIENMGDKNG